MVKPCSILAKPWSDATHTMVRCTSQNNAFPAPCFVHLRPYSHPAPRSLLSCCLTTSSPWRRCLVGAALAAPKLRHLRAPTWDSTNPPPASSAVRLLPHAHRTAPRAGPARVCPPSCSASLAGSAPLRMLRPHARLRLQPWPGRLRHCPHAREGPYRMGRSLRLPLRCADAAWGLLGRARLLPARTARALLSPLPARLCPWLVRHRPPPPVARPPPTNSALSGRLRFPPARQAGLPLIGFNRSRLRLRRPAPAAR